MIKVSELLDAVKVVLDDDSTLSGLLNVSSGGTSKVVKGVSVPTRAVVPFINMSVPSNIVEDPDTKFRQIIVDIMVRVKNADHDLVNYDDVDAIGAQVMTLLENVELTVASGYIKGFQSYGEADAAKDFDRANTTLKQFSFSVQAI